MDLYKETIIKNPEKVGSLGSKAQPLHPEGCTSTPYLETQKPSTSNPWRTPKLQKITCRVEGLSK